METAYPGLVCRVCGEILEAPRHSLMSTIGSWHDPDPMCTCGAEPIHRRHWPDGTVRVPREETKSEEMVT